MSKRMFTVFILWKHPHRWVTWTELWNNFYKCHEIVNCYIWVTLDSSLQTASSLIIKEFASWLLFIGLGLLLSPCPSPYSTFPYPFLSPSSLSLSLKYLAFADVKTHPLLIFALLTNIWLQLQNSLDLSKAT